MLPGPPTIFQSILDHPDRKGFDLSTLRLVVTGAAVVPVELVRGLWDDLGVETVLTAYGLTEATGTVTMCRRGDSAEVISGTSGRAIPDVDVRIVDTDGIEVPRGEAGEIVVRGYNVMRGYFNDAEATDEAIDIDGWLHTGDVGTMDEAGNVTITDRLKDMYVSGGFNVYPAEVEAVLRLHPGVAQVAVVGVPDRRMGEVGLAVVVPAAGRRDRRPRGRTHRVGQGAPGQLQGAPPGGDGGVATGQRQRQGAQAGAPGSRYAGVTAIRGRAGPGGTDRPVPDQRSAHRLTDRSSGHRVGPTNRPYRVNRHTNPTAAREQREGCHARHRVHR